MSKAGRIMLLVAIIFAIAGAMHETTAKARVPYLPNQASTCSSTLVSTQLCNDLDNQACTGVPKPAIQKQIAGAVVIAQAKTNPDSSVHTGLAETVKSTTDTPDATQIVDIAGVTPDDTPLNSDFIFDMVNQYRASRGLAHFEREERVCALAATRSNEIIAEIGGQAGYLHSGLYNRGLPYWIWENAKYGSNESGTVAWWKSSPVHHQSMVGNYKYSCVKCTGTYCVQLFTSFESKSYIPEATTSPTDAPIAN